MEEAGIDYDAGVARLMNDSEFYVSVLKDFLDDETIKSADEAFKNKDYKALFSAVHQIKGVSGSLDMKSLFSISSKLADLLRHMEGTESEIAESFKIFRETYESTCTGIKNFLS